MTRRIRAVVIANINNKTRTLAQVGGLATLILVLLYIADSRYRMLPSSLHNHLPSHHTGSVITDVTIRKCSFSSCRLDPEKWHRVEKDLYLGSGWLGSAWLHVQRKKEEELSAEDAVVVGVRVSRLDPGIGEKGQGSAKWESRPGGIWILRSKRRHDSDSEQVVTAVDVLFGADAVDPRPGWRLAPSPLEIDTESHHIARLTVRHGQPKGNKDIVPRVRKDGHFKILQVSDLHLSTGVGTCRDAIGPDKKEISPCEADPRTLDFLDAVLDSERPDLVVLSGDQIEGPASPDPQTAMFKFAAPFIERGIPFATIFGNHDDEGPRSVPRSAQMMLLQTLPYSLSKPGPEHVDGIGNYYIEVLAPATEHSAVTIYFLDTHGLSPDEKKYKGYDWIKQNQIDWFRSTASGLKKSHAKYTHIHLDMAFIHIPLPEFNDTLSVPNIKIGGDQKEWVSAPAFNSHFYDALAEENIVAVGAGHDHANDYCALKPASTSDTATQQEKSHHHGPWMCYAGGSGFGGYGGYGGYHRRMRVWEVDANAGRLVTWTRLECCGDEKNKRTKEVVLVEGGRVVVN